MERYEYLNGPPAPRTVAELAMRHDALVRQLADAQATIAALQAVIDDHHRLVREMDVRLNGEQGAAKQASLCDIVSQVQQIQAQLTQRTAELEAAKAELNTVRRDAGLDCGDHSCLYAMNKTGMRTNGGCRCSPKRMKNDLERSRKAYDDLQAELERVRGELAETSLYLQQERANRDSLAACVDRDVKTIKDLRTLIKALPKVEGEIRVGKTVDDCWFIDNQDAGGLRGRYKDDGPKYAALLQHRQGMEG